MFKLGKELELDAADAFSSTYACIGIRGSGKSYAMLDFGEEALEHGYLNCFLDPQGICHGLRSRPNGKPGYPVLLIGGPHNPDIELNHDQGTKAAAAFVSSKVSCIYDLSEFRKAEARTFITAFCIELFKLKNRDRTPTMMYLDEAHLWAPQNVSGEDASVAGALEDITGRGRQRGLFMFLTTQRAAKINKNVLSQVETLFVMRQISPQDRKAMELWMKDVVDPKLADECLKSLASLKAGEAWAISPAFLGEFRRFKFRERHTADTSSTPKAGTELKPGAKIATLPAGIAESMRLLLNPPPPPKPEPKQPIKMSMTMSAVEKLIEKVVYRSPISAEDAQRLVEVAKRGKEMIETYMALHKELAPLADKILREVTKINASYEAARSAPPPERKRPAQSAMDRQTEAMAAVGPSVLGAELERQGLFKPKTAEQRVLSAIAQYNAIGIEAPDKDQVAARCGFKRGGSTARGVYAKLRNAALIDYPSEGKVQLTEAGRMMAGTPPLLTLKDLHEQFKKMAGSQARGELLDAIIDAYPEDIAKSDLCIQFGWQVGGSTMRGHFAALRDIGAIDYPSEGYVRASELLFPAGVE